MAESNNLSFLTDLTQYHNTVAYTSVAYLLCKLAFFKKKKQPNGIILFRKNNCIVCFVLLLFLKNAFGRHFYRILNDK